MRSHVRIVSAFLVTSGLLGAGCSNQADDGSTAAAGGTSTNGHGGTMASAGGQGGGIPGAGGSGGGGGETTGATSTLNGGTSGERSDAGPAVGGQGGGQTSTRPDASAKADASTRDASSGTGGAPGVGGSTGPGGGSGGSGDGPVVAGGADGGRTDAAKDTSAANDVVVTFHNGVFWNDTQGKRIEAHGGGFYKEGDTYYWIGEDKSQNSGTFKAVNCYASKDLVTWQFRNAIITRSTATQLNTSDRIVERPKVTYNDSTKKYVMWLHWDNGNYSEASAGVFQSDTIDGDYTYVKAWKPLGNMSRDCNLFKDDDGKAYFMSAANENADMMLYELTDDYLDVKRLVIKLWAGAKREAPAMFKVDGTYFMITSAATGWDPNQAQYASASAIGGPWTNLTNVGDSTTFDTQSTYVIPVVGSEVTTYIYAGDRWKDPDLVGSKYIWLPLVVKGTKLGLDYAEDWTLNLTTGRWSSGTDNSNYVPQDAWKLIKVDSEETSDEDDKGIYAFDGLKSTIWHTKYTGGIAPLPHEIQIDLGATYNLTGMSYLPRQDNKTFGIVGQYEFYASTDSSNWGTAVKTGTFANDATEKVVTFASKPARYIRFRALSEVEDRQYTAVAELNVIGTAQ
jgi:hypothetical protein